MNDYFQGLVNELKRKSKCQRTPIPYADDDYAECIITGLKTTFIDFGWTETYYSYVDENEYLLLSPLPLSVNEYVINASMLDFYQVIQQDVNNIIGYSTDSLKVTNADKPYENISNEINKLRHRQIELFEKISAEDIIL